ncbi:hypothetical protein NM688_g5921 [Phlebia brevispora]|uniref:Uncharacterized protein n=1 Tax=Phlebia brevispora TaxID=194682 RepID=A0ACC1SMW9_9APHY|nr:hypothetical protein NM688_g5921 [Phlebia brevispora]
MNSYLFNATRQIPSTPQHVNLAVAAARPPTLQPTDSMDSLASSSSQSATQPAVGLFSTPHRTTANSELSTPNLEAARGRGDHTPLLSTSHGVSQAFSAVYTDQPSHSLRDADHALFIDSVCNEFGFMEGPERTLIHQVSLISPEKQILILLAETLQIKNNLTAVQEDVADLKKLITKIDKNTAQAWKLSPAQTSIVKKIVRHYLIRPVPSYTKFINLAVLSYIKANCVKFQLGNWNEDSVVRETVAGFAQSYQNTQKSNLRKTYQIFTAVQKKESLDHFTTRMINKYYIHGRPSEITRRSIMAQLALARKIAAPLAQKTSARGADTGFWKDMHKELRTLTTENGGAKRTNNDKWKKWEDAIIADDVKKYGEGFFVENDSEDEDMDISILEEDNNDLFAGIAEPGENDP